MGFSVVLQPGTGAICLRSPSAPDSSYVAAGRQLRGKCNVAADFSCSTSFPSSVISRRNAPHGSCTFGRRAHDRSLFGRKLPDRNLPQQRRPHVHELKIESKTSGAGAGGGSMHEDRRDEERSSLLGAAAMSVGVNAILLLSVTKPEPPPLYKSSPSTWQSLFSYAVWGAILLNAFLQYRVLAHLIRIPGRQESRERADFTLKQRVVELEENVRETVNIARILSRQVEKLGVRFRVTRRTLRDPIQETAVCAQKTSEIVTILAQREDMLEKELRGLQRALLAMQEQQVKQLALVSVALGKTLKEQRPLGSKMTTEPGSPATGSGSGSRGSQPAAGTGPQSTKAQTLSDLRKGFAKKADLGSKVTRNGSSSVTAADPERGDVGAGKRYTSNGASQIDGGRLNAPKREIERPSSEENLSKVDFWKESGASLAKPPPPPSPKQPTTPSVSSSQRESAQTSPGIGSFFNGRRRAGPDPTPEPKRGLDSEKNTLEPASLSDSEDELDFVEQPDYESDSWLR